MRTSYRSGGVAAARCIIKSTDATHQQRNTRCGARRKVEPNLIRSHVAGVGSDVPAIENSDEFPLFEGLEIESVSVALCLHRVASCLRHNLLLPKQVIAQEAAQRNTTW